MNSDDDVQVCGTPPELVNAAENVILNLLPNKSKAKYEYAYKRFMDYCQEKKTTSRSENVMIAYFSDLSTKLKASTLWSNYFMLRATLSTKENIDITKYSKLRTFLKRQSDNYKPKKSKVLSDEQIETFITQAPDDIYLMNKVALIFGVAGACLRDELYQLNLNDIEDFGSKLLIKIPNNKTNKPRSFVINETHMPLYKKYVACRPENFESCRFFFKYSNGKGCRQVVGIHQFGKMPQIVAKFLNLPNANEYTGHCFRRSSATILVNAGADLVALKRHGGWKSSNVAEGYIEESFTNKVDIADKIFRGESDKEKSANTVSIIAEEGNSNNIADYSGNIADEFKGGSDKENDSSGRVQPMFNNCTNCNITINIQK